MELEKTIGEFVELYENFEPLSADDARDPQKYRQRYRRLTARLEAPLPAGISTEDAVVDGPAGQVRVRVYRGDSAAGAPCCLFFHGGGWTLGDLDTHDAWAADLSRATGATVIATDYRLGPEHPYPAAFDDCYAVLEAVATDPGRFRVDPSRLVVYGDSAGGNLAAAVCLKAREAGGPAVSGQVLVYPALHYGDSLPSWERNRDAPVLSLDALHACWRAYLRGQAPDAFAAPLLAATFAGLPPAWIVTAGHDPLRDDGLLYAERLSDAGVDAEVLDVPGLVHGCFRLRHSSDVTREAWLFSVRAVRDALAGAPPQRS